MAFTSTSAPLAVSGSFTATGTSESMFTYAADLFVFGTFDGTVTLEAQDRNGGWRTVCEFTEAGVKVVEWAARRPMRLNCTVFTSGQIDYILESINEQISAR